MITKQELTKLYADCLAEAIMADPSKYAFGVDKALDVAGKMTEAISTGSFSHGGEGLRRLCKTLGIKHTRKAITNYYKENVQ